MSDQDDSAEPIIVEPPLPVIRPEASTNGHGRGPELVPPVGFPLAPVEIFGAARGVLNELRTRRRARRALADYLGVRRVWLFGSGRAALTVALRGLASMRADRDEVIVPAYTCYTVASSIVRAGLRVRLVDLERDRFEIAHDDLEALVSERTLAIIVPHLLGFAMNVKSVHEVIEGKDVFVIDDAAQALGARHSGRNCGAGGHLGILSFGRGKPLTTLGGGAITCDDPDLSQVLEPIVVSTSRPGRLASTIGAAQAGVYSWLLRPRVYWLPSRLPFLKIGQTEFDLGFAVRQMPAFKFGLLGRGLARLDAVNEARRRTAERLLARAGAWPGVLLIDQPEKSYATYLRFPLIVDDAARRLRALSALRDAGISAGSLYPRSLNRVPEVEPHCPEYGGIFPNAERMAQTLMTLPTYPFVTQSVIERMCDVLDEVFGIERHSAPAGEAAET